MSRVLAASLVAAAAMALSVPGGPGAILAAVAVSGAILGVWSVGSVRPAEGDMVRPRSRLDRAAGLGLALSLVAGTLLAAGLADGPGFFGLPRSLWGLLLGVWLVPLILTSAGFAASFRPPKAMDVDRLRAGRARSPWTE